jgi:hypothetical protein
MHHALTQCGIYRSDALAPVEENAPFFRRDYGGIQGRKKNGTPLGEIYFIGIIDILTTYSYGKSAENFVKSLFVNKVPPSCGACVRALMCVCVCADMYRVVSCSMRSRPCRRTSILHDSRTMSAPSSSEVGIL